MTDAGLTFGALPILTSEEPTTPYVIEVLGDEADWGNPEAVITSVASMLMDGDKARIDRFGNREMVLPIQIKGTTLDDVAEGQAALMAEVNKGRNTLAWKPPGIDTVSVYDVVYSLLTFNFVDLDENRAVRQVTLTLTCLPFARRDELEVVIADPIPSSPPPEVVVDACTSLDGWAAMEGGPLALVDGGGIACPPLIHEPDPGGVSILGRTGLSVSVDAGEFVVVDVEVVCDSGPWFELRTSGGAVIPSALFGVDEVAANRRRYYVRLPGAAAVATLYVTAIGVASSALTVFKVTTRAAAPHAGTTRQRSFVAEVGGTARAQASLRVEIGRTPGGDTPDMLLYTAPLGDAIQPPMRQWLTSSGEVNPDASLVSGASHPISTPSIYRIPAANVGRGTHLIVARLRTSSGSGSRDIAWGATTVTDYTYWQTAETGSTTLLLSTLWSIHQIGVVHLPTVDVATNSTADLELTIQGPSGVLLDELWLFNLDAGRLSWFGGLNETDAQPSAFEVRSADLATGRPAWLVGKAGIAAEDVSVAERMIAPGIHEFRPGPMSIFVVTPVETTQTATATYYPRFAHHVTKAS